jgi:hypothetical protein
LNKDIAKTNVSTLAKKWSSPLLIYFALAGYFLSFSTYGLNVWDEGGYANGTLRTHNGERAA